MFILLLMLPCVLADQVVIMLFATNNVYRGYEVNDVNCQTDAATRGFVNPEDAKAWVEGFDTSDWTSEMRILGPTKKRITQGNYFLSMPSLSMSFEDAGTGCTSSIWTGSIKMNEDGYNCEDWSVAPGDASGVNGRISSCTTGGLWSETESVPCNQYYRHMCYIHVEMIPTNQIMFFATTGTYQGNDVKDANCELSALAYGFPAGAKALVQGFNQTIFRSFTPIIGPTGTSLSYGFRFIEGNYLDVSLAEAQTCVGFYGLMWSGWLLEEEPILPVSYSDCNQWTQTDLNATLLRCTSQFYNTIFEDFCTEYHQHLCYVEVDEPPWTRSPTFGSPTSQQPTKSPTPVNQLVLFATTNTYHAYEVSDANCVETAESLGFSNPSVAVAFVENDSQDWEDRYVLSRPGVLPVVGPTGVFIKYVHEFLYNPNALLAKSFQDAGVGCSTIVWTGILFPTSTLDDCDNWGVSVEAAEILTGTYSTCMDRGDWQNAGTILCKQQLQHLCYIEGALPDIPTASPVEAPTVPTLSPTAVPPGTVTYRIFATQRTYQTIDIEDANCVQRATELGFVNVSNARVLASTFVTNTEWNDTYAVTGPTGIYISSGYVFRRNLEDQVSSLENALVGCTDRVWMGFAQFSFSTDADCSSWTLTSSFQTGTTGTCDGLRWKSPAFTGCNTEYAHLCFITDEEPVSIAPSQSPTVYEPGPRRSPYYLFATDDVYRGNQVRDENCQLAAVQLGLPTPQVAWALVATAPNLVDWDDTRDVFSVQGQFITKAGNLRTQEAPLSTYLSEIGCTGELWTGFADHSFNLEFTCANWSSTVTQGSKGTCDSNNIWRNDGIATCTTELKHLCVYNQTLPPSFVQTKSPTTSDVTSSPTAWVMTDHDYILFLTEESFTGDEVSDAHCVEAAETLELDSSRVVAYIQGHTITWNHSANVFTPEGEFIANVSEFSEYRLSRPLQLAGLNCTQVWSGFLPGFPPLQAATCDFWTSIETTGITSYCDSVDFVSSELDAVPCTTAYPHLCLYVPYNSHAPTYSPTKSPVTPTQQPTNSPAIQSYTVFVTDETYKGYEVNNANCREKASELGYDTTKVWSLHAGIDFSWWRNDTSVHGPSGSFIANSIAFQYGNLDFTLNQAGLACDRVWTGFQATSFTSERRTCLDWHVPASSSSNHVGIVGGCAYQKAWRYVDVASCDEALPQLCIYTGATNTIAPTKQPTVATKSPTAPTLIPTASPSNTPVTLFSTLQTYQGNQVRDSNCWDTAVALGFSNPTSTWALVRGNPNLTTLSVDHGVIGPTGVQIGVRTPYFLDAERTMIHPALLNDARVCFGPIWTGGISMQVTNDCNNWSSTSGTGIVGSCDHVGLGAAPSGDLEQVNHAWAFASINDCTNAYAHLCIHPGGDTVEFTASPTVATSPVVAPTQSPGMTGDFSDYYLFLTETRHVGYDVKDENCEATAANHGYSGLTKALVLGFEWDDNLNVYGPYGAFIANASAFRSQYIELELSLSESGLECTEVWTGFISDDFIGLKETSCEYWSVPFWMGSSHVATYGSCTPKTYWASYGVKQCTKLLPHLCVSSVQFVKSKAPTMTPPTVMPTIKRPTTNPPSWAPTKQPTSAPVTAPTQNRYVVFAVPEKISMAENSDVFQELCIKQKLRLGLEGPVDPLVAYKGTVYSNWQDSYGVYSPTGLFIATGANFRLNNAAYARNLRDAGVGCDGDIWTGLRQNSFQTYDTPCNGPGTHAAGSCVNVNNWRKTALLSCSFRLQFLCVSVEPCVGACSGSQPATTPYPTLTPTKPPTGTVDTVNRYVVYTTTTKHKGNEVRNTNCHIPGSWALVAHAPQLYHWNDDYLVYGPSGHYIGTAKQFREQTFTDSTLLGSGLDCTEIWTGFYAGGGFNTIDANHCDYWESPDLLASYGVCDDTRGWGYIGRTTCDDSLYHLCAYRGLPFGVPPSSPPVTRSPTTTKKLYVYGAPYSSGDSMDTTCAQRAVQINMPYPDKPWTYVAGSSRLDGIDLSRIVTLYPQETPVATLRDFRNNFYAYGSTLSQHDGVCGTDVGPYVAQFQTHSFGRHPFLTNSQGRSLYRLLLCLSNQSPTAEVYYDFEGTRLICAFFEEDLFGFTPEPTYTTAFPSRAPTTSFPTKSPTIAPTIAYYTVFATSESYRGYEVRDINCQKTAYSLGLPEPLSAWALVEGSSKTILPSKDVYSHTGVYLGKASAFRTTQMTMLETTLQDAGLDCTIVWRGATIQGYLPSGLYSEVATCLNWTVSVASASRFNGATVGCMDIGLQVYRTSTCATSWKHLCIYEGTPPPPTSAPTGRPTLSCNADPPIAQSAFVFTSDQCLTKRLYDIAKTTYIDVQSVSCLNDTTSIGTNELSMVGVNITHVFDTPAITVDLWYRVLSTPPIGRYPLLQTVNLNLSVEVQEETTFLMVNDTHGIEMVPDKYLAVVKDEMVCSNDDEELVCSNEWVEVGSNTLQTINYFGLHALSIFEEALSILDVEMLFLSTPFVGLAIPFDDDPSIEFS